jgi:hypothetical protein
VLTLTNLRDLCRFAIMIHLLNQESSGLPQAWLDSHVHDWPNSACFLQGIHRSNPLDTEHLSKAGTGRENGHLVGVHAQCGMMSPTTAKYTFLLETGDRRSKQGPRYDVQAIRSHTATWIHEQARKATAKKVGSLCLSIEYLC